MIEPQIEKLKNGILSVMDKIEESTSSNSKLPEVSSAMTTARSLIEHQIPMTKYAKIAA